MKIPGIFSVFAAGMVILAVNSCSRAPHGSLGSGDQRAWRVDQYLAEFSSPAFMNFQIGPAIRDVLMRLPPEALEKVMDRRRPVLFVDVYSSGTGRFASTSEVIMSPRDIPAFQEGMTLIKLSDALAESSPEAIKGIVAHELAHRVLDHVRSHQVSCDSEREANRLIKSWGFTQEFEAASRELGRAKVGEGIASCQEVSESRP